MKKPRKIIQPPPYIRVGSIVCPIVADPGLGREGNWGKVTDRVLSYFPQERPGMEMAEASTIFHEVLHVVTDGVGMDHITERDIRTLETVLFPTLFVDNPELLAYLIGAVNRTRAHTQGE